MRYTFLLLKDLTIPDHNKEILEHNFKEIYKILKKDYLYHCYDLQHMTRFHLNCKMDLFHFLIDVRLNIKSSNSMGLEFQCLDLCFKACLKETFETSILETEPEYYKFKIEKIDDSIWHISKRLQDYNLKIPKILKKDIILLQLKDYLIANNIDLIFGLFKVDKLKSLASIFNNLNDEKINNDILEKFMEGCFLKRIPNKKYQKVTGIDRKTHYKICNFLESISPGSWYSEGSDSRRRLNDHDLGKIRVKIINLCHPNLADLINGEINRNYEYVSNRRERIKEIVKEDYLKKSKVGEQYLKSYKYKMKLSEYCTEINNNLRTMKKRINRLPNIFTDFNLYNLLKLTKKRPSPFKICVDYVRITGLKKDVMLRINLMKELKEFKLEKTPKFRSLQMESLNLNREREWEILKIREAKNKFRIMMERERKKDEKKALKKEREEKEILERKEYLKKYDLAREGKDKLNYEKSIEDRFEDIVNEDVGKLFDARLEEQRLNIAKNIEGINKSYKVSDPGSVVFNLKRSNTNDTLKDRSESKELENKEVEKATGADLKKNLSDSLKLCEEIVESSIKMYQKRKDRLKEEFDYDNCYNKLLKRLDKMEELFLNEVGECSEDVKVEYNDKRNTLLNKFVDYFRS